MPYGSQILDDSHAIKPADQLDHQSNKNMQLKENFSGQIHWTRFCWTNVPFSATQPNWPILKYAGKNTCYTNPHWTQFWLYFHDLLYKMGSFLFYFLDSIPVLKIAWNAEKSSLLLFDIQTHSRVRERKRDKIHGPKFSSKFFSTIKGNKKFLMMIW